MSVSELQCSFCRAVSSQVNHLIKGDSSLICDSCVQQCVVVIEDQRRASSAKKKESGTAASPDLTPEKIHAHLNQYVIGQERAKKLLSVAVYNHYKRINVKSDVEIQKSNVLLIGPTGTGKTLITSTIAKLLDVPFVAVDITGYTEAGYVGADLDQIIGKLVSNAKGSIEKAQRGIVFLDEADKIARVSASGRDVNGEGVQNGLLKMLEGTVVTCNPTGGKIGPQSTTVDVDTTNILFICGGAFSHITDQTHVKRSLGVHGEASAIAEARKPIGPKDLVKYGMAPEFVGRLPIIAQLDALDVEQLVRIIKEPKNSLMRQFQALFLLDGVDLTFDDAFIQEIAELAHKDGTGARGLRGIIEQKLFDAMYRVPGKNVAALHVDKNLADSVEIIAKTDLSQTG